MVLKDGFHVFAQQFAIFKVFLLNILSKLFFRGEYIFN